MLLSADYLQRASALVPGREVVRPDNVVFDNQTATFFTITPSNDPNGGNILTPFDNTPAPATDDDVFNLKWLGRFENANPFDTEAVKQAALGLAKMLGQDAKIAYESAADFANTHFSQFKQFYTEASSPEIIWDGIKSRIFARAGIAEPDSEKLKPDQIAYYGNIAQSRQEDFKALDERKDDVNDFEQVSMFGKAVGWVTGSLGSTAIKLAEYSNQPDNPYATPIQKFEKLKPFNSNISLLNTNVSSSSPTSDTTNKTRRLIAAASVLESPLGLSIVGIALLLLIGFAISRR